MYQKQITPVLILPGAMGAWALAGLFREATSASPEDWRMLFFGVGFLVFAGLGVAVASRRPPRQEGGA